VTNTRYVLEAPIGSGGMGTVYRAYDQLTQQYVALKQVHQSIADEDSSSINSSADLRLSLAQEFKLLASVHHPHIIQVLDYGFDSSKQPFFTMELIPEGQNILEAAAGQPLKRRAELIMQLLEALAYLHHRKIVHCDVKPSNVLVHNGQVKVLDFGLSLMGGERQDGSHTTAGTLAYLAPEVLAGGAITPASDLYSVGIIMYEMLLGQHPYDRRDVSRMIKQILYSEPDLSALDMELGLNVVVRQLLSKLPEERFESANHAILALASAAKIPVPPETLEMRESYLQSVQMVGRRAEFERLLGGLDSARRGTGSAWVVSGESGVGKTRLLEEARIHAMVAGATVIRANAENQGARPFQLWQPLLNWLPMLTELSDEERAIVSTITRTEALSATETAQAQGITPLKLANLLRKSLARASGVVVVILEDIHWSTPDNLAVLALLTQNISSLPMMIVASVRDEEIAAASAHLRWMNEIRLMRLSNEEVGQLASGILGNQLASPRLIRVLQEETEGNAFFLIEMIRALANQAGEFGKIATVEIPAIVTSGSIDNIIAHRVGRVPQRALRLLSIAAVAGRTLDFRVLGGLDALDYPIDDWISDGANASVLEYQNPVWRFSHERVRDRLQEQLSPDEQRSAHAKIAQIIEQQYGPTPEKLASLAYHWGASGNHEREVVFARLAADYALPHGSYTEALRLYERILALADLGITPPEVNIAHIQAQLAEAHLGLGGYQAATVLFESALAGAQHAADEAEQARILSRLGDIAYATESFAQAQALYGQSLAVYRGLADGAGEARVLNNLGNVAYELGEDDTAAQYFQESLALSRALGKAWGMAGGVSDSTQA
jgi:tetratricopeptide (TPR) repeat protein